MNRRHALAFLTAATLLAGATAPALAATPAPEDDWRQLILGQDRYLHLKRPQSGEDEVLCYWRKDVGWDAEGYLAACRVLRDVKYNRQHQIDPALLDTLCVMQGWLRAYGRPYVIHILSGYRTPEHNAQLEDAAKDSLHMKGRAVDLHIPGMDTKVLSAMGQMIATGGVGLYASRGFLHLDTGPVRAWEGRRLRG